MMEPAGASLPKGGHSWLPAEDNTIFQALVKVLGFAATVDALVVQYQVYPARHFGGSRFVVFPLKLPSYKKTQRHTSE